MLLLEGLGALRFFFKQQQQQQPRAHPVVEPHACSHAIVELTNVPDHILWHVKTGEYCPEEGSINGVVRFGKVDKSYRAEFVSSAPAPVTDESQTSYRW